MLRLSSPAITSPVTSLINRSLEMGKFPDQLKEAQVAPVHKKNSELDTSNFRPVSVLKIFSKLFERAMHSQLTTYFENIFHPFLSAFRKGYGCQTVLLKAVEDWKKALDEDKYAAAILMDLSKAFDCLPHDLLLQKLDAYGLSNSAVDLLQSYLEKRKQCVKIGSHVSDWRNIIKGVPQGSILGPLLFNVFINDIFHVVKHSQLYNYADDNTLSFCHSDISTLKSSLEQDSIRIIEWFEQNKMQANPEKFQALAIGTKTCKENVEFTINNINLACSDEVKLLGVTLDYQLQFDSHISDICKKASRQLNVLKRIGHMISKQGRIIIYYSFILSNFNFCPLVWHFAKEGNLQKIEKIQYRALRFIYNDYDSSYESLLAIAHLPSLHVRRMRSMAIETFKILHGKSPMYLNDLISYKTLSYSFRYSAIVNIPRVRTTRYGLRSFRYAAAKLWNELPDHFRQAACLEDFCEQINNWFGSECRCSACR